MMYFLYFLIALVTVLLAIIMYKTISAKEVKYDNTSVLLPKASRQEIAQALAGAVQIETISYMDRSEIDYSKLLDFHAYLEKIFPLIHKKLSKEVINGYSLLYKLEGSEKSELPVLYMAHMDVVPIAEGTLKDWKYMPFSGAIADGFVWGRGALDTKVSLITTLFALEELLKEGFVPKNDVYFAFGHDEEISGMHGAEKVSEHLLEKGIRLKYVLDEGGVISVDSVPGVHQKVALVGVAEKGYLDLKVTLKGHGGHASMPPKSTAVGRISKLIVSAEKHQIKPVVSKPVENFLKIISPYMSFVNKMIINNLWLFKPVFIKIFLAKNTGNAMLRTTTAANMVKGSNASNVLPEIASVVFNFRINPVDSISSVIEHIKSLSNEELEVEVLKKKNPSIISSSTNEEFGLIGSVIQSVFEDVAVAPYVMLASSDSIKYEKVCDNIYRFIPAVVDKKEIATIHGTNERISLDNLYKSVEFYKTIISKN